ncbi:fimbrial protein [Morganella psychrotolerans]|nr:type 1 fimbrial protein [Morganella psychrotolerans]
MGSNIMTPGLLVIVVCFSAQVPAGETKQDAKTSLRFGAVQMQGSILEPVCTISTASREQVVMLSDVSVPMLRDEGQGPADHFWIRLTECTVVPVKGQKTESPRFLVTFEGAEQDGHFQLTGSGKGASLAVSDRNGHEAVPGHPLPPADIDPDNMALRYQARLVKNSDELQSGYFRAILGFKLEYY